MIQKTYNWILELDKNNSQEANLRFRVKWNHNKNIVSFYLGYKVEVAKWSKDAQRCNTNSTHGNKHVPASIINKKINLFEEYADTIFNNCTEISTTDFKDRFNQALGKSNKNVETIFDKFDLFVNTMGEQNNWSSSTYKKFKTLKKHLQGFKQNLSIDELTKDTMQQFLKYLIKLNHRNTHIEKTFKFLRWFLRWLIENNYYNGDAHLFKPNFKGTDGSNKTLIYLTWEELNDLYNLKIEEPYLDRIRDVFCFCCFTSLRYSDVKNLKRTDIKNDHIDIVTQKTTDALSIDLNNYSSAILEKYKDCKFDKNAALPVISNQKMNQYLKDLANFAGINESITNVYYSGNKRVTEVVEKWQLVSTHCGRRTFIVNALYLGIPAEVVMKWTGHSDYSSMKPYIEIIDDLKSKEMKKFNEGPKISTD